MDQPKKRRGRPTKAEIEANKKGKIGKGKVGRPPGTAARIEEFKARLLSTSGEKVIDKIFEIALDDEHQGQVACLKMCMDRLLPISHFDKEKNPDVRPSVSINISSTMDAQKTIEHQETMPTINIESTDVINNNNNNSDKEAT